MPKQQHPRIKVLDHGYVQLVNSMGDDAEIVEAARMSNDKGFLGWGPTCSECGYGGDMGDHEAGCTRTGEAYDKAGDEKLLKFLWDKQHTSPFEMGEIVVEVKAPIMVFREWHRHRTQSYNEMSARYVPLPKEDYYPTVERVMLANQATSNKQAQGSGKVVREQDALEGLALLADTYDHVQKTYDRLLELGWPKELARLPVAVGRYSKMRAKANLLNWLKFLRLRCDTAAQWEIREYANQVALLIARLFPRTYQFAREDLRLPMLQ